MEMPLHVGRLDLDEAVRAQQLRGRDDDAGAHGGGFAVGAVERGSLALGELELRSMRIGRNRRRHSAS